MSPDEILQDLRDIHLPVAEMGLAPAATFNFWPLAVVILMLAGVLALRHWRKRTARSLLQKDIQTFAASPTSGGMRELLSLRNRSAGLGATPPTLPETMFTVSGADDTGLLAQSAQELGRAIRQ